MDVYIGAQIPGPMKCDETTMWVYKVVLSICGQYMDDADSLHSSLGDGSQHGFWLPRIGLHITWGGLGWMRSIPDFPRSIGK